MKLTDIALLAPLITLPLVYIIGVSYNHYTTACIWIENHEGVDISYYKDKVEKKKNVYLIDKVNYYIGYPGRALAFRKARRR